MSRAACVAALLAVGRCAVVPLPQCQEPRPGTALALTAASSIVASDSSNATTFAVEWLKRGLNRTCGGSVSSRSSGSPTSVWFGLSGNPSTSARLTARGLTLSASLGSEGYLLDVAAAAGETGGALLVANEPAGLFHGVQTLLQLANASHCAVPPERIEDWPDAPLRAVYMYGGPYDSFNKTFLTSVIDTMTSYKLSAGIFEGLSRTWWAAMRDPSGAAAASLDAYAALMRDRHLEFIPNLSCGSGGASDVAGLANAAEGVWVRDEPFVIGPDDQARPLAGGTPIVPSPPNANFTRGLSGWAEEGPAAGSASAGCWANTSFGPSPGLPSVECRINDDGNATQGQVFGLRSKEFVVEPNTLYAWSAKVHQFNTSATAQFYTQFEMIQHPCSGEHCGSTAPLATSAADPGWRTITGIHLTSDETANGLATMLLNFEADHAGHVTGTFHVHTSRMRRTGEAVAEHRGGEGGGLRGDRRGADCRPHRRLADSHGERGEGARQVVGHVPPPREGSEAGGAARCAGEAA